MAEKTLAEHTQDIQEVSSNLYAMLAAEANSRQIPLAAAIGMLDLVKHSLLSDFMEANREPK